MMAGIGAKDTKPEMAVRRALHTLGFRFRLHSPRLPGRPDIVLSRFRTVIQVKGCFWHGHHCLKGRMPKQNAGYWLTKIQTNIARDKTNERRLRSAGWRVRTVWECDVRRWDDGTLRSRMKVAIAGGATVMLARGGCRRHG